MPCCLDMELRNIISYQWIDNQYIFALKTSNHVIYINLLKVASNITTYYICDREAYGILFFGVKYHIRGLDHVQNNRALCKSRNIVITNNIEWSALYHFSTCRGRKLSIVLVVNLYVFGLVIGKLSMICCFPYQERVIK